MFRVRGQGAVWESLSESASSSRDDSRSDQALAHGTRLHWWRPDVNKDDGNSGLPSVLGGPFGRVWASHAAFTVGGAVSTFVTSWWIALDSGSALSLGIATIAWVLPSVLIGPIGGIVSDRVGRKRILLLCSLIATIAMLVAAWMASTDRVTYWHLYTAIFVRAVASAVQGPAMVGLTAELVPKAVLRQAAGLSQTLSGAVRIGGPLLGAALVGSIGLAGGLVTDAAACGLSLVSLVVSGRHISTAKKTEKSVKSPRLGFGESFSEGVSAIRRRHGLVLIILVATGVRFFAVPGLRILPLFVSADLGGGAALYAAIATSQGIGVLAGGVLLSLLRRFRSSTVAAVGITTSGIGFALVGVAWQEAVWMAVAGAALVGVGMPLVTGCKTALIQAGSPGDAVARVMSLHNSMAQAAIPFGVLVLMPLAEQTSVRLVLLLTALAYLVAASIWAFNRSIRNLEDDDRNGSV